MMMLRFVNGIRGLCFGAILGLAMLCQAQDEGFPMPTKEHELLKQFAGEWTAVAETVPAPGEEALKCVGTETAKMVGGYWLVSNGQAEMMGMQTSSVLSIGYDPNKKKYIGTFLCSMDSTLWTYEGTMDESGKKLTLMTEGPSPLDPTQKAVFREVLELKDQDHKSFTSYMKTEDGNWQKFVTVEYERKK